MSNRITFLVMRKVILLALTAVALVGMAAAPKLFPVLKSKASIGKQPGGFYLLPTNQLLQPWGEQSKIKGRPVDATLDYNRNLLAVLNTRDIEIFDAGTSTPLGTVKTGATSYTGIAFRPGTTELWTGETARNGPDGLLIAQVSTTGKETGSEHIALPGHAVPTGISFSKDAKFAYVALSRNNSVAVFDAASRKLLKEVPTGIAPFAVVYASSVGKIFVTNRGGRRATENDTKAPTSGSDAVTNPVTGTTTTGTLTVIDAETFQTREVPVGLAPSGMALSPDENLLAIANGHSDTVSILDTHTLKREDIKIPSYPEGFIGSQPIAVAFSADNNTIYTACGGINAITFLRKDAKGWKVAGSLPTGWFPSAVVVTNDHSLRVVNIKGTGNTDNGKGAFNSTQYEGSLIRLPVPSDAQLAAGTREVIAANAPQLEDAGGVKNLTSLGIQHVLFIIKENRTYDQLFGDLSQANSDPKLVMYGRDVTPNHHALAEKYVILDNFFTGGAISFDGHQWLMQSFVSDYTERAFAASPRGYAWNMSDALTVAPTGFFWQGAPKTPSIRIYGEFGLPARWDPEKQITVDMNEGDVKHWSEYWKLYKEGKWQNAVGEKSGVPALQKITNTRYPENDTNIPDQIRAEEYLRELGEFEKSGNMPQINVLTLNEDHTNGTRPGSPTPRAMVADNDLALGRIVEGLTKSRFWASTLVLVVEDDAQNGLDHVDGHRTIALAIGPHIRRGVVDSNHYNHSSMVRTIQEIFRIPPQTRFVAAARPMTSIFTAGAVMDGYQALTPKIALDEMNPPVAALNGRQKWAAEKSLAMNWHDLDDAPQDTLNRILWWDAKGYDKEYPILK
jgi:YVTN family beta-propeller protein